MADVLTLPGQMTNGGVPAPYLQGTIFPARDRLGGRIALGMGQMTRRFADILSGEGGVALNEAQLQALFTALAQGAANQQVVNYNFEGLVGPPGPPGKTMVQYLPPIPGIGQVGRYGTDGADGADGADGIDAFDNIDIPIPYEGWEGAFTNNSPGAGSVAWTAFKVKYKGTEYTVAAGNTANAYLYWDAATPTVLSSTGTKSGTMGVGKFFTGWNNAGTFYPTNFQKLITAGHASFTTLSALGLTVYEADIENLVVTTAKIANLNVTNGKIADGAVSADKSARTAGGTGGGTVQTVSGFVSAGGVTMVKGDVQLRGDTIYADIAHVSVKRGSTTVWGPTDTLIHNNSGPWVTVDWDFWESPGAGTYTYTIYVTTDTYDLVAQQRNLWCREGTK